MQRNGAILIAEKIPTLTKVQSKSLSSEFFSPISYDWTNISDLSLSEECLYVFSDILVQPDDSFTVWSEGTHFSPFLLKDKPQLNNFKLDLKNVHKHAAV